MEDDLLKKPEKSIPKIMWINSLFFLSTSAVGMMGGAIYIYHFGISLAEILLVAAFFIVTSLSITVGYHRLFSHAAFKTNDFVRFLVLFFGAASFEQSALTWSSQHRNHHKFVDTEYDPYSIKKGFFYAHLGWMMFWRHAENFDNARDLQKNPMIAHQHNHYNLWAVTAGIFLPIFLAALTGHALGGFLLVFCARVTLVYHITWCINSFAHTFGKATYDIDSTAKDSWFTAILTNGEGYHNFHHRFPGDYRNGVRWYDWDPSKWIIAGLEKVGFAWDVLCVSRFRILFARITADNQRAHRHLLKEIAQPEQQSAAREIFNAQYERLRQTLVNWEHAAQDYSDVICGNIARQSERGRQVILRYMESNKAFQKNFAYWKMIQRNWLRYALVPEPVRPVLNSSRD